MQTNPGPEVPNLVQNPNSTHDCIVDDYDVHVSEADTVALPEAVADDEPRVGQADVNELKTTYPLRVFHWFQYYCDMARFNFMHAVMSHPLNDPAVVAAGTMCLAEGQRAHATHIAHMQAEKQKYLSCLQAYEDDSSRARDDAEQLFRSVALALNSIPPSTAQPT